MNIKASVAIASTNRTVIGPAPAPASCVASRWSKYPSVYEINAWIWLSELSQRYGKHIDLTTVPPADWDALALGFDAVWLMGVWERSAAGVEISDGNADLIRAFEATLPDFSRRDNVGSAYCVRRYQADRHLGGLEGLQIARQELSHRGMKLILDFVPNHVASDHSWTIQHPEYFIHGTTEDHAKDSKSFVRVGPHVLACGRDPYFPAWSDVVQLNAFQGDLRKSAVTTVLGIAQQCDGVRCDMAMLLLNDVFERTWGARAGSRPSTEYWTDIISAAKQRNPNFLFIAEAYWDLEWMLQQLGFDFCYDKKLYDLMEHADVDNIRLHLHADSAYQDKLLRFIENHDEPRASATFSPERERAAAAMISTLPGMKLFHEGQFEGRKVRVPVCLARRPAEHDNADLRAFYHKLMRITSQPVFCEGIWKLCELTGWPDNLSFSNLMAWSWTKDEERYLIVINMADSPSQGRVIVDWPEARMSRWHLEDCMTQTSYDRDGDMLSTGMYVDLSPWNYHLFRCSRANHHAMQ